MPSAAEPLTADRPVLPSLSPPRALVRHAVPAVVLLLAALTFLAPSAPTYDPWAWIIWGREVLHLDLSTDGGPSWKPLPVLLTTPFALTGPLAPDLWLLVARAGAIAGVVLAYRVVRRLGGGVPGGVAAAAGYAMASWTIRNAALGNSEGLLVALVLGALDRHLAGRRRQAFALGVGAALLRPEAWLFLGLYGAWLLWRDRGARRLVAVGFASLPALWLLPELWGSHDLLRAMHRAQTPRADSVAFDQNPARAVLDQFSTMLTPPVLVGLGGLVLVLVLRRAPSRGQGVAALGIAALALGWVGEVAFMTSDGGFSGNIRYLIAPAALAIVLAGTGVGWLVHAVAGAREIAPRVAVAIAAMAAVAFAVPSLDRLQPTFTSLAYQAHLADEIGAAVDQAGGRRSLLACGTPYTGDFQVPIVAWYLHVHTSAVDLEPAAPAVVFRARNIPGAVPKPALDGVGGEDGVRTLAATPYWRIVGTCGPREGTA